MKTVNGDIWDVQKGLQDSVVCVPTNEGWTKDGRNPMGRGVAKQAIVRFPSLPRAYGEWLRQGHRGVVLCRQERLILVPVKPCIQSTPHLSWKHPAVVSLILRSLVELDKCVKVTDPPVLVVPFGCGNGGLSESHVLPLMERYLNREPFVLVVKDG